jgi:hypothetical protein
LNALSEIKNNQGNICAEFSGLVEGGWNADQETVYVKKTATSLIYFAIIQSRLLVIGTLLHTKHTIHNNRTSTRAIEQNRGRPALEYKHWEISFAFLSN